jgi:dTDP-4-amino-4,6-dideoxygalactose transaminase
LSFKATAAVVKHVGADIVFADIEKGTYALDPNDFRHKITNKTKCVIPVHLGGIPAKIPEICAIARENGIFVVEDACQALGAKIHNIYVGTWGDIGVFSFYPSKLITTGEGGALVSRVPLTEAEELRNHGSLGNSYEASSVGYNMRMTEMGAAIGNVQMRHFDELVEHYKFLYKAAEKKLSHYIFPKILEGAENVAKYVPLTSYTIAPTRANEFYPPLYWLKAFRQDISLSNAEAMWRKTFKFWLD